MRVASLASALLLLSTTGNAGVIIGNTGNGIRPTAQRHTPAVRLSIQSIRWYGYALPGPVLPRPAVLLAPVGAVEVEILLDGKIEVSTPGGGLLVIDATEALFVVPLDDPQGGGPLGFDIALPGWLETATDRAGTLVIDAEHPWYPAALRAIEDGLIVR